MKQISFIILFFSVNFFDVFGDQPRYSSAFMSENKQYMLSIVSDSGFIGPEKWKLVHLVNKNILYEINYNSFYNNLSGRTVFISNDGKNVIAVNDFSFGIVDDNTIIMSFFYNGIITKEYKLKDLLDNTDNVSASASHFKWAFQNSFNFEGRYLKFITYELYEYTIDINTGAIISKTRDDRLSGNTIYAYGIVSMNNNDTYNFEIMQLVYGQPKNDIIIFRNQLNKSFRNGQYITLIIRDNVAIYSNNVLFNLCTYKKS